jgi:hypothetical protein
MRLLSLMLGATHVVEDGKGSDDGVDQVDTGQAASPVVIGEERHQTTANDPWPRLVSKSARPVQQNTYAGMMQAMIKAQRWDCRRIPNPTNRVKKMLTAPEGVFIRAACFESYLRLRMRVAEYVVTTPLETDSWAASQQSAAA